MPVLQELVLVDIEKFAQYTFITHLNAEAIVTVRIKAILLLSNLMLMTIIITMVGCDDQTISSHQCYGDVLNKVNWVKVKALCEEFSMRLKIQP